MARPLDPLDEVLDGELNRREHRLGALLPLVELREHRLPKLGNLVPHRLDELVDGVSDLETDESDVRPLEEARKSPIPVTIREKVEGAAEGLEAGKRRKRVK